MRSGSQWRWVVPIAIVLAIVMGVYWAGSAPKVEPVSPSQMPDHVKRFHYFYAVEADLAGIKTDNGYPGVRVLAQLENQRIAYPLFREKFLQHTGFGGGTEENEEWVGPVQGSSLLLPRDPAIVSYVFLTNRWADRHEIWYYFTASPSEVLEAVAKSPNRKFPWRGWDELKLASSRNDYEQILTAMRNADEFRDKHPN